MKKETKAEQRHLAILAKNSAARMIKKSELTHWKKEYLHCAALYWDAYQKSVTFKMPKMFFENMKNYCALMILGRIDSDVVLLWLEGKHHEVRKVAVGMFDSECNNLRELLSSVEKRIT